MGHLELLGVCCVVAVKPPVKAWGLGLGPGADGEKSPQEYLDSQEFGTIYLPKNLVLF